MPGVVALERERKGVLIWSGGGGKGRLEERRWRFGRGVLSAGGGLVVVGAGGKVLLLGW